MKSISFYRYRYRFVINYTIIGFLSLCFELIIIRSLKSFSIGYPISAFIALVFGILSAFYLNIRFNFHIAHSKRKRALMLFVLISLTSFVFQFSIRQKLYAIGISMDASRFIISAAFFLIAYTFHKRFSFNEYKKVGVAIYANGVENIRSIYDSISDVSDFIHLDIVDKSFNLNCSDVKAYRAETVRAYWPNKIIEVHIMSKTPTIWLPELLPHVDRIYIHTNIDENLQDVLSEIKKGGCNPGLVIKEQKDIAIIKDHIKEIKNILVLAIENPGFSGQKFNPDVLSYIEELDSLVTRKNFSICVDGGITDSSIKYLNVEAVVSGSFVLNATDPIRNIMYLQTSGEYDTF